MLQLILNTHEYPHRFGLVYDGASVIENESTQANVSISNLTLNITNDSICMECDRDVIVIMNITFLRRITNCNNLVNASVYYSSVQKSVSVIMIHVSDKLQCFFSSDATLISRFLLSVQPSRLVWLHPTLIHWQIHCKCLKSCW